MIPRQPSGEPNLRTPCVRNCCLDQDDVCLGCGRSLAEILGWNDADPAQRAAILQRAAARRRARAWPPPAAPRG